jgi:anti-sigma factor RsiW
MANRTGTPASQSSRVPLVMSDPPTECAWAREAASARIDGELGEVESLRLDRHLRACLGCFVHAADIGGLAIAIRCSALEQPATRMFTQRGARPRRRIGAVAVGAALAVATGGVVWLGFPGSSRSPGPVAIEAGDAPSARADATQQRLLARLWDAGGPPQGRMEAV